MRKTIIFIILTMLILFLVGCNVDNMEISENIAAPKNTNLPISGEWVIKDYKLSTVSGMDEKKAETYLGMEALFNKDVVSIGENNCLEPTFKIKNVNSSDYLVYHYKTSPESLGIESEEIQIVSVTGIDQFFNEFIKISEDIVIVNIDGVFFYLTRVKEEVDDIRLESLTVPQDMELRSLDVAEDRALSSGVLLGLKSLDLEDDDLEKWNYRTVFIRTLNGEIASIQEMENILLPRRSGFWKIEVNRVETDGKYDDNIVAYPLNRGADVNITMAAEDDAAQNSVKALRDTDTIKNILFVSNDYISIENIHYRNKGQRYLEFYPVANIEGGTPIKISDIMGDVGKEAFLEGFNKEIIAGNEQYRNSLIDLKPKEESFGLFRKNGLWVFKGRANYIENEVYMYKDFGIKAIPSQELVSFDELYTSWDAVKLKVPEALDVFTSPNEDIAIVLTYNDILIYKIENGNIVEEPTGKVELNPGEKVIMAEWAMGKYAQIWEEEFIK